MAFANLSILPITVWKTSSLKIDAHWKPRISFLCRLRLGLRRRAVLMRVQLKRLETGASNWWSEVFGVFGLLSILRWIGVFWGHAHPIHRLLPAYRAVVSDGV